MSGDPSYWRCARRSSSLEDQVDLQEGRALEREPGCRWLASRIGPNLLDAAVITTGQQAYRRRDGIGVIPAALLTA